MLFLTFFPGESLRFLLISHDGYLRFLLLSFLTNIWAFSHEGSLRFIPLSYILDLNIFSPHECYRFLLCICRRFIISQMRHVANREAVSEWFQLLVKLTPLPSHLLPPPLSQTQSGCILWDVHTRRFPTHPPGVLVRAIGAASWMGLAVWMPWPSSLLSDNPSVPITFLFHP